MSGGESIENHAAVECRYKVSARFGDVVTVAVAVEEFRGVKLKLRYRMTRGDDLLCEGRSEHCFLNRDGKIISLKRDYPALYGALQPEE